MLIMTTGTCLLHLILSKFVAVLFTKMRVSYYCFINVSEGSVDMQLIAVGYLVIALLQISTKCASERIL